MYLKEITVKNFRSIKKAQVDFSPGLNIVIGTNGSGKSNLLQFISRSFSAVSLSGRSRHYPSIDTKWKYNIDEENDISISIKRERVFRDEELVTITEVKHSQFKEFEANTITWSNSKLTGPGPTRTYSAFIETLRALGVFGRSFIEFNVPSDKEWLDKPFEFSIDASRMIEIDNYSYFDSFIYRFETTIEEKYVEKVFGPKNKNKNYTQTSLEKIATEAILKSFDEVKKELELIGTLKEVSPIQDIRIKPSINFNLSDSKLLVTNVFFEFKVNGDWILWNHLSDGTRRLFYIVSQILYSKSPIILIEEPELGIHPYQLHKLMIFITEQSKDKQIILSTHSPIILDTLKSDELDRIIISKISSKGTAFKKLTAAQKNKAIKFMDAMELSYYWLHSDLEK